MHSETKFTVRYAETDQMGIVHHSNYAIWFEAGRSDFLKNTGISNSSIEAGGVYLPLYELKCEYKYPARYEDEIAVFTYLKKISCVRVLFGYQIFNAKTGKLLATGETMHAWTDKTYKPINAARRIPSVYSKLASMLCGEPE